MENSDQFLSLDDIADFVEIPFVLTDTFLWVAGLTIFAIFFLYVVIHVLAAKALLRKEGKVLATYLTKCELLVGPVKLKRIDPDGILMLDDIDQALANARRILDGIALDHVVPHPDLVHDVIDSVEDLKRHFVWLRETMNSLTPQQASEYIDSLKKSNP